MLAVVFVPGATAGTEDSFDNYGAELGIAYMVVPGVFEPNSALTRTKLRLSLLSYLTTLWQQGALAGRVVSEEMSAWSSVAMP